MKKIIKIILILLVCFQSLAQELKPVSKGFITISTGQKMEFSDLNFVDTQVIFTNVTTKTQFTYFLNSINLIEDESHSVIFKKFIPTKSEPDLIKEKELIEENDTLFKPKYPDGVYYSKEDFVNKKVSNVGKLIPKGLIGFEKPILSTIVHNCFFYIESSDQKLSNVFAVSFQGHLYFQINAILSNRNKKDRAQSNDFPNSFVRVIIGGDNYFYTEANLANAWAQGLAYGGVGGAVGGSLASTLIYGKGVVWDFKNKEFNIFKNCEDFNEFIASVYSEGVQVCVNQQPNYLKIREIIKKIK
ncbi:MAG: hypothetical protein K2X95_01610 [Flavobacteriaceae bacterium]|nr:hypothetical protein [Flavobacteriaceae bacterium]